jgi:Ca-activated chloride channel homolog
MLTPHARRRAPHPLRPSLGFVLGALLCAQPSCDVMTLRSPDSARDAASPTISAVPLSSLAGLDVATSSASINRAPAVRPGVISQVDAIPREHRVITPGLLSLDVRLGSSHVMAGGDKLFVAARVKAERAAPNPLTQAAAPAATPAHLSLVIDRSRSMSERDAFQNAKLAAEWLIRDLGPHDFFSVITYDDHAQVIWPVSPATADARAQAIAALHAVTPGDHTCLSCALTVASDQAASLSRDPATPSNLVQRVILLSDGKPTQGVQSQSGLSAIIRDLEQRHITTSTIGVGLLYGEDLLAALALDGNGNHYFVEDPTTLEATLQGELACVRQVVARAASLTLTLSPGVRFVQGFDRAFNHDPATSTVTISLGDLHAGAEATVLLELDIDPLTAPEAPTPAPTLRPITSVALRYDDIVQSTPALAEGTLYARTTHDLATRADALDSEVAARVEQALIVHAIELANAEIRLGNYDQAQTIIRQQSAQSAERNAFFQNEALGSSIRDLQTIDDSLSRPQSRSSSGPSRLMKDNAEINLKLKK